MAGIFHDTIAKWLLTRRPHSHAVAYIEQCINIITFLASSFLCSSAELYTSCLCHIWTYLALRPHYYIAFYLQEIWKHQSFSFAIFAIERSFLIFLEWIKILEIPTTIIARESINLWSFQRTSNIHTDTVPPFWAGQIEKPKSAIGGEVKMNK